MIIELREFKKLPYSKEPIALTSIPGDPIHPGHISCLQAMRLTVKKIYGGQFTTVCLVNDDNFLINKKGFAFIPLKDRLEIIDSIKNGADFTIPFSPSRKDDMTVIEGIKILKPMFFLKGGDRKADSSLPEWNICKELGCKIIDSVGASKIWSSSNYIRNYRDFILKTTNIV